MSEDVRRKIRALAAAVTVDEIMIRDVIAVPPEMSLESFIGLVLDKGISGAPVVDEDGRPIGVVSKTDLVREQQLRGEDERPVRERRDELSLDAELGQGFHIEDASDTTVGDIMFPVAFTITSRDTIGHAASLMGWEGIHRLPVVDAGGKVVGIVSALDILRWMGPRSSSL